jgi:hypothetical protein
MIKLPFYGNKKLRLAFEYGLVLSETAKGQNIEVISEMMKRGEEILVKEFRTKTPTQLSTQMVPNILAMLEPDDKIKL